VLVAGLEQLAKTSKRKERRSSLFIAESYNAYLTQPAARGSSLAANPDARANEGLFHAPGLLKLLIGC
jgi:hypothetical protein